MTYLVRYPTQKSDLSPQKLLLTSASSFYKLKQNFQ